MNFVSRFGAHVNRGSLFNFTARKYATPSANTAPTNPPPPEVPVQTTPSFESKAKFQLTKTMKIMCVWAKRYPSLNEVPDHVNPEVWKKVRSIVRIKVANYTMALILVGCGIMIITGKRAHDRGESLMQRNLDWHEKYSEGKGDVKNLNLFGK